MSILPRYLAKEFAQNFLLGLGAFGATYLIVEFSERINAFLHNRGSLEMMAAYFLYKIPMILFQVAPPSILLASLIALGLMSKHNEIIAMKSAGISLWRIALPVLVVSVVIYLALLGMSEFVIPPSNQKARNIRESIIQKKKPQPAFKQNQVWIRSHRAIYKVDVYHPEKNLLEGVTIFQFNSDFRLVQRVDARRALWKENRWVFSEASLTQFTPEGSPVRKEYRELVLSLPETPSDFRVAEENPDEMNYRELRDYVIKIESDGYDSRRYRCALHAKISFPFIGVIMAFLGIPLALRKEKGAGIALGVGLSILISFLYWVVFSFCLSLGKAEVLPPFIAAWVGNFIFALVGVYLFLSVRH